MCAIIFGVLQGIRSCTRGLIRIAIPLIICLIPYQRYKPRDFLPCDRHRAVYPQNPVFFCYKGLMLLLIFQYHRLLSCRNQTALAKYYLFHHFLLSTPFPVHIQLQL